MIDGEELFDVFISLVTGAELRVYCDDLTVMESNDMEEGDAVFRSFVSERPSLERVLLLGDILTETEMRIKKGEIERPAPAEFARMVVARTRSLLIGEDGNIIDFLQAKKRAAKERL